MPEIDPPFPRTVARLVHWGPLALYLTIVVLFLMPMPLRARTEVIQTSRDASWSTWWLWWGRESMSRGHSPYFTDRLLYPTGASLYLSVLDMVSTLASVPLQSFLGVVATYNLLIAGTLLFAAYAMFLLALEVTGSVGGALLAGATFAFAPLTSYSTNMGHLPWTNVGFLPLAILGLMRLERSRPLALAGWASAVSLATLVSLYQGLFLLVFAGLYATFRVVVGAIRRDFVRLRSFLLRLCAWGLLAVLFIAPVLVPTLREGALNKGAEIRREWVALNSVDVLDPFRPNPLNPIFGGHTPTAAYAFGYTALGLAAAGVLEARARSALWVLTLVVFSLLSWGPLVKLGPHRFDLGFLPYNLLYAMPFGKIPRTPFRFLFIALVGLAVLVAFGVAGLQRSAARRGRLAPTLATASVLVLLLVESWPGPRPLTPMPIHPFYHSLAASPPGAVLELPGSVLAQAMYWQTAHGHPLLGGYLARYPPEVAKNWEVPVIRQLWIGTTRALRELTTPDVIDQPSLASRVAEALDAYGVRYVILHTDAPSPNVARVGNALREALPSEAVLWDDGALRAYRVPSFPDRKGVVAGFGIGWGPPARRAHEDLAYRSAEAEATLALLLLDPSPREALLEAQAIGRRRVPVDVELNAALLATLSLSRVPQTIRLRLSLQPGYNALRFRARAGADEPEPADARRRYFALGQVRVESP